MPFTLQVVACVLRHQPRLKGLPHVGPLVTTFLGPDPNLSLRNACKFGSIALLNWLWDASCVSEDTRPPGWSLCNFLRSEKYYYRYQFYESLQVAAGKGDVTTVKWFLDHFTGCEVSSETVAAAARGGHLDILKCLLEKDAGRGHSHILEEVRLEENGWIDSVPVMPKNWSGPGNVVRWGGNSILSAVAGNHPEIARWLYDNTPHQTTEDGIHAIIERAVVNGDFELAEFLLPQGRQLSQYVGFLMGPQAIEDMLERGYLQENKAAAAAAIWISARKGNLDCMKRIAAQHPKPPRGKNTKWLQCWEYAMHAAAEGGDIAILKWVLEHPTGQLLRKQIKEDVIMDRFNELLKHAATGGHVDTMEYLVEQGCTDEYAQAMVNAARKGHLNCIEWLLEHTYQFHPQGSANRVVLEAAKLGYLDILKFLHAPRYTTEEMSSKRRKIEDTGAWWSRSCEAMDEAAANGHLEVVQWLYANRSEGCTTKAMDLAARNGHLKMLKWLHAITTAGCTVKAMNDAASQGHAQVVKWLHANRLGDCTVKTLENAIGGGKLRLAAWLILTFPQLVSKQNRLWMFPKNLFDTLLFLQVNCSDMFTKEFGRVTKSDLSDEYYEASDILIKDWLEEKYPGRPSKKGEVHFWSL